MVLFQYMNKNLEKFFSSHDSSSYRFQVSQIRTSVIDIVYVDITYVEHLYLSICV